MSHSCKAFLRCASTCDSLSLLWMYTPFHTNGRWIYICLNVSAPDTHFAVCEQTKTYCPIELSWAKQYYAQYHLFFTEVLKTHFTPPLYSIDLSSFLLEILEQISRDLRVWMIHLKKQVSSNNGAQIIPTIFISWKYCLCLLTGPILWRADSVTTGTILSTFRVWHGKGGRWRGVSIIPKSSNSERCMVTGGSVAGASSQSMSSS